MVTPGTKSINSEMEWKFQGDWGGGLKFHGGEIKRWTPSRGSPPALTYQVWRRSIYPFFRYLADKREMPYLAMLRKVEKWSWIHIWNLVNTKMLPRPDGHRSPHLPSLVNIHGHVRELICRQTDRSTDPHTHTMITLPASPIGAQVIKFKFLFHKLVSDNWAVSCHSYIFNAYF